MTRKQAIDLARRDAARWGEDHIVAGDSRGGYFVVNYASACGDVDRVAVQARLIVTCDGAVERIGR